MMWSPLLVVQKPCQPEQGKRYQEELKLDPPAATAAAEHVEAVQVKRRSGHASWAGQLVGERDAGWNQDQEKV